MWCVHVCEKDRERERERAREREERDEDRKTVGEERGREKYHRSGKRTEEW